jgi:hypothetical protein
MKMNLRACMNRRLNLSILKTKVCATVPVERFAVLVNLVLKTRMLPGRQLRG